METGKARKDEKVAVEMVKSADIESALDETGFGTYNVLLILTCGLVLFAVNTESYSIGYVLPAAEGDLSLTVVEKSILTAVAFMGIMSTQFMWGYISDTRGRRNTLFYTLGVTWICSLCSAFSPTFWLFVVFRFLTGAFVSCASATVFPYLGEFMSSKHRSSSILAACVLVGLSLVTIPGSAWSLLTLDLELNVFGLKILPWRLYVLLNSFSSLFAVVALHFFPESPKFLLYSGKSDAALEILGKIYSLNTKRCKTEYPVRSLLKEEHADNSGFFTEIAELFHLKHLKYTLLCSSLQFGIFATSSGILLWYPDILQRLSKTTYQATVCEAMDFAGNLTATSDGVIVDDSIFEQNLIIGAFYLLGYVAVSAVIRHTGIRSILLVFLGAAGVSAVALTIIRDKMAIEVLFVVMLVSSGLSVGIVNAAVVGLFPTSLRAMATCLVMFSGRLGSVVSSSVLDYLIQWRCDATLFIYAAKLFACATLAFFIPNSGKAL